VNTELPHYLRAVKLTADMVERRDLLKRLHGDKYRERTERARSIIKAVAQRDGVGVVEAAMNICKKAAEDGHGEAITVVVAALVDLCEEES
jgi:hypothetical protein